MEMLKEALMSRNIFAWVIVLVLFVLCLKLLKSAGKGLVIFIWIVILFFILSKYFPGVVDPLVDFVRGGWLGDNRPDRPW
jgi:hypothetical protein